MRLKILTFRTAINLILMTITMYGQDYYVDATGGNDNNTGTSINSPWKTISKVNSFQFGAGSTIHFKRGEHWRETLTVDRSGTENNPITFTNYGSGHLPIIYGSRKLTGWVANGSQYRVAHTAANIFFENTIDNMKWGNRKNSQIEVTGNYDFCVGGGYTYVKDTTYYSIESPQRTNGIYVSSGVKYVVIDGIDIRHAIEGGIESKNVWYSTVQNCYSWFNGSEYDLDGEGIYWIAGKYDTLRSNTITDVGFHGIYCSVFNESNVDSAVGNIIEYNIIGNCYHTEIDLMNTGGGSNNIHHIHRDHIVRYNTIFNDENFNSFYSVHGIQVQGNVLPGIAMGDIVNNVHIYGNLIFNLNGIGIYSNYFSDNLFIYNNTIANGQAGIAIVGSGGIHSSIKNNIVHITGADYNIALSNLSTKVVDYNFYYHSIYSFWGFLNSSGYTGTNAFANYRNLSGFDLHGFNQDPIFYNSSLNMFSLTQNSAAINSGDSVGLNFDILGNPIVGVPDIGAFEFQESTIIPVELLSFSAKLNTEGDIEIKWQTATELNNLGFELHRKTYLGAKWEVITFIAGSGTSIDKREYKYIDKLPSSNFVYYRLKQIDSNGTFKYSEIITLDLLPGNIILNQNFPNPFNPSTTIIYQSPYDGKHELTLYNLSGEKIRTLVEEFRTAGAYSQVFNLGNSDISSGIYIYELKVNKYIKSKKMILLK